jgi:hypothetical protein
MARGKAAVPAATTKRRRPAPQYLVSVAARPSTCKCGRVVLKGIDEGLLVRVEQTPIGEGDELGILLAGRRTYVMTTSGELWERTPLAIRRGAPAGKLYAEHMCPRGNR